jgi:glycosyltransferase involved in cell wall biosynthesis
MSVSRTETTISRYVGFDDSGLDTAKGADPIESVALETRPCASANASTPRVAVLICTHQGGHFLRKQLDSISAQSHASLSVWASDDGSKDDTRAILTQYRSSWGEGRLSVQSGPQQGFAANFLSLVCRDDIEADYFAFADQDDIWEPDKLSRAIEKLESVPTDTPALYCSRTRSIDEGGQEIGFSPMFKKTPGFANALVQNIAGGNTMVMNKAARELLRNAGNLPIVSHDWWAYILITGAGGVVFYDPYPGVRYRQHGRNLVGANAGLRARLHRIRLLPKGQFREWNTTNTQALQRVRNLLTPENQRIFDAFCRARNRWFVPRVWGVTRSGVYRQTTMGNLQLIAATILKKL